jgi:choline dehydrogenase-like flavoprotein
MDASALPTNLGVNPQHTIMAVVFRAAERLANDSRNTRSAA